MLRAILWVAAPIFLIVGAKRRPCFGGCCRCRRSSGFGCFGGCCRCRRSSGFGDTARVRWNESACLFVAEGGNGKFCEAHGERTPRRPTILALLPLEHDPLTIFSLVGFADLLLELTVALVSRSCLAWPRD